MGKPPRGRMEIDLERACWDSGRSHHRWSMPFHIQSPFGDPGRRQVSWSLRADALNSVVFWAASRPLFSPPTTPAFFFFPSLPKMLTGFYFVFFHPVNSPDGVGYMGKKCGCLWEEEHIEFQSRRFHDMQLRQKLIGNKDFPGKHG